MSREMRIVAMRLDRLDPADFPSYCESERHGSDRVGASYGIAITETEWGDITYAACADCLARIEQGMGHSIVRGPRVGE